jgi:hypothetical protein
LALETVLTQGIECLFLESSALTGENVEEIFSKVTNTIIYKIDSGEIPEDLIASNKQVKSLGSTPQDEKPKSSYGCC